ncbi:MAG: monovalent cation/H+ antiporter subunit D family protein [Spirochaetaceae bacterium]|nr:monovalent cation/H+ antiporter subunit D family protein [Myxococcales bacterium]MCB9724675.1 monovalent cation/H+ antiporter subunit D family protein [Spirochaetaceae bacterium]
MDAQTALVASLCLPVVGAIGVQALGRTAGENVRDAWTVLVGLATFGCVTQLVGPVMSGARPSLWLPHQMAGLGLGFEVEPLGLLFGLVASGLWILTSLYGFGYMRGHHEKNQTRFFTCFALAIAAALGIAFAGDLVTLFLFYEILTFSTFPLVTHAGTEAAVRAGRVYLGILVSTSVLFLLLAILWTASISPTLRFTPGGILDGHIDGDAARLLFLLFAYGVGKAALMPFHRWLPAAMVAPTPVSALLHAVAVVKAGVFTVLKVALYVFGIDFLAQGEVSTAVVWIAAITILAASIRALYLDNFKARLAYSTISQLSYIVLGAALATSAAAMGAGLHILMHALGKITLFFVAGAVYVVAHKTEVSQLDGLGRRMPFTFGAFCVASFSIIGLPPLGGAWSKWYLVSGAFDAGQTLMALVFMASSLLSIGYLMPIVVRAFFRPLPAGEEEGVREIPMLMLLPICATALGCLLIFFYADAAYRLLAPVVGLAG